MGATQMFGGNACLASKMWSVGGPEARKGKQWL